MFKEKLIKAFIFILLLMLIPGVLYAADYVLVMDSSGSMKKTDPQSMRIDAAKLFVRLLKDDDRVSVIKFSNKPQVLIELTQVKINRFKILRAVNKVDSDGLLTDIFSAVATARDILLNSTAEKKIIVLMSDGKMDLGAEDKNEELTLKLLDELLPECKKKGIKIYTIAFTKSSDIELLKEIAFSSKGLFYLVTTPEKMHLAFTDIFSNTKLPDEIPIKNKQFLVDKAVKEMNIILTKKESGSVITLVQPDGRKVTYKRHPSHYKWYSADAYEMVTITAPLPGLWKIMYAADSGNRVFIYTDLKLRITDIPRVVKTDKKLKLYVWLQEKDEILKGTPLILKAVEFNTTVIKPNNEKEIIKLNDDGIDEDDLADDGVYTGATIPEQAGEYTVVFKASGKAFVREKIVKFFAKKQNIPKGITKEKPAKGEDNTSKDTPKKTYTKTAEDQYSFKQALIKFLVFNIVLIVCVGIIWGVFRWKKSRQTQEDGDED